MLKKCLTQTENIIQLLVMMPHMIMMKKKKKLTDHRRKVTELILQLGNKLNHSFEYADHRHNCITKNHDHRSF